MDDFSFIIRMMQTVFGSRQLTSPDALVFETYGAGVAAYDYLMRDTGGRADRAPLVEYDEDGSAWHEFDVDGVTWRFPTPETERKIREFREQQAQARKDALALCKPITLIGSDAPDFRGPKFHDVPAGDEA